MKRTIRYQTHYRHSPERVWTALTHPKAIAAWLMENDFEARVGHQFTMRTEPAPGFDGVIRCEVLELDPPRRMAWSWKGGPIDTVATFQLEAEGAGTRLVFEQSGFQGARSVLVSFILGAGTKKVYGRYLPDVLDRLDEVIGGEGFDRGEHSPSVAEKAVAHVANRLPR